MKYIAIIFSISIYFAACNRPTAEERKTETPEEKNVVISNDVQARITAENPFENQPNEFCTIIRKLEVLQYAPNLSEEELNASPHPPKYCLLDICLDDDETSVHMINLGDEKEQIMTAYKVITLFPSADSARVYATQYKIVDVVVNE
ncbi:MAG: hypothetical protein KBF51_11205 [Chitinophagales bacterium]|nr:hypothetical protein [Bacteroidota bacterium]MBP8755107.1 hypothetical protein [Chitinophagales bacterium]MBP9190102.1 hypothetical protein [Chitinophagales bacterium]MBP9550269.1 hypothetical protein [Chitinophagales bacterium]MBP9704897.1 hypothetical protein [Chitinophagales bacterium]